MGKCSRAIYIVRTNRMRTSFRWSRAQIPLTISTNKIIWASETMAHYLLHFLNFNLHKMERKASPILQIPSRRYIPRSISVPYYMA